MQRLQQNVASRTLLDEPAGIHDQDAIDHVFGRVWIMTYQKHRHLQPGLQCFQEVKYLSLGHGVQRGGWLIRDDESRTACDGLGNDNPLFFAST